MDTLTEAHRELDRRPTISEFVLQLAHLVRQLISEGQDINVQYLDAEFADWTQWQLVVDGTVFHLRDMGHSAVMTKVDSPLLGVDELIMILVEDDDHEARGMTPALLDTLKAFRAVAAR